MIEIINKFGKIEITNEAISAICSKEVSEAYGIVGLGKRGANGILEIFRNEHTGKGVKVSHDEKGIILEVYIVVEYGVNLKTVSQNLIEKLKYSIEKLTGINVSDVIVNIQSIKVEL
ncbi:MAG: Asp23/Gls24 family envelope stress response protein [Thermoanaerobacteraceae bacterium]